jgi:hypothetical protein
LTSFFGTTMTFTICFAGDGGSHFFVGERRLLDLIFGGARRDHHQAAQLAVDLHRNFDLILRRQRRIVLRPRSFQQIAGLAGHLPQFVRQIRRHRRQQQRDVALHLGHQGSVESHPL